MFCDHGRFFDDHSRFFNNDSNGLFGCDGFLNSCNGFFDDGNGLFSHCNRLFDDLSRFFGNGSSLMCNAVVLEGEGFWASGLRAMISNTHRSASGSVQVGVGTSIDEILGWFPEAHAKCTGIMVKTAELRTVLHELRRQGELGART